MTERAKVLKYSPLLSMRCNFKASVYPLVVCVLILIWSAFFLNIVSPWNSSTSKIFAQVRQNSSNGRRAVLWTSDLHDAARCDMASMFPSLGHKIVMAGFKGRTTPYPNVFANALVAFPNRTLSDQILNKHPFHSSTWIEEEVRALFDYYKDDDQFKLVDGIVCMFPASYCEAWMPFNKSLIIWAAHRYSLGRCNKQEWERLNEHLQAMVAAEGRGHMIAGITLYDVEYINYFTGIKARLLPSSTLWYAKAPEGEAYNDNRMRRPEILIGPSQRTEFPHLTALRQAGGSTWKFDFAKAMYGRYEFDDLLNHRAMILFPYATTSWGFIEVYALGIPIFVPEPGFLYELGTMDDRRMRDHWYCGPDVDVPPRHPDSTHPYSPEDNDLDSFLYWINFSDFYQWPFITQFSSWDDLIVKLEAADFNGIHKDMSFENARRKQWLAQEWSRILESIPLGGSIPESYDTALRRMWNTSRLMAT